MKKPVILLISIMYLVSLIVVTFFGIQISMDQYVHYITDIKFNMDYDEEYKRSDGTISKIKYIDFDEDNESNNELTLDCVISPTKDEDPKVDQNKFVYQIWYGDDTYTDVDTKEKLPFAKLFKLTILNATVWKIHFYLPKTVINNQGNIASISSHYIEIKLSTTDGGANKPVDYMAFLWSRKDS